MRPRALALLLALLLPVAGASAAQEQGVVSVRFLDDPIDDLRSYANEVLSVSSSSAPLASMKAAAARSAATTDVLLVPYYEVDRTDPRGVSTLFAVRNETGRELPVRILYLTAVGAEEQQVREVLLAPHATHTVNVRDVQGLGTDPDGVSRGLVVLGVVGAKDGSDLLSGDYFFIDPATDYATGNTLLNVSLDDSGNELCAEWGTRFMNGGSFSGVSRFRFVVDVPDGSHELDPPTAVGTVYDEAGAAVRSFEIRTDLHTFELASADLVPDSTPFGALAIRFPATTGALLVEHSGFHRLSIAFKAACRDGVK